MSAVSVTANTSTNTVPSGTPPARQCSSIRTTVAAMSSINSNREAVAEEEVNVSQMGNSGGYNKHFSRTIRGESVLESTPVKQIATVSSKRAPRSPNPTTPNPNLINPRTIPKGPKTRGRGSQWNLVARVFTKAFLVFILVGLGTTMWNWTVNSKSPADSTSVSFPVSEERIIELEEFLKKTTKMMQVQLELVDMKFGKHVQNLRQELEEKIGDETTAFLKELRNLKAHTAYIEDSLVKLTGIGVLSREEVLMFVNSVVDARAVEGKGQALSLDDVKAVSKRIVEEEIEKHSADGLGKIDYALGSAGGKVVRHSEGYFCCTGRNWAMESLNLLKSIGSVHPFATKVVEPSFGHPGQCLSLKGSNAFVEIALRTKILPEAVTLEHVAKSVAYDRSNAPKDFRIIGWLSQYDEDVTKEPKQMFLLGEFSYDLEKSSAQTFNLPVDSTRKAINMIKLEILSNHGSSSHTCIYRLRVHGSKEYPYISYERNGSYA